MTGNLPFNFKQTYQVGYVCPIFLLLSRFCLEQNVLHIVIIILLCRSENIPNLIILLSMDLLSSKIGSHFLLNPFFVTLFVQNFNILWIYSCVSSSYYDGPYCCCKSSFSHSSLELEIKIKPTYSFMPTFLLGFLKLYFFKFL